MAPPHQYIKHTNPTGLFTPPPSPYTMAASAPNMTSDDFYLPPLGQPPPAPELQMQEGHEHLLHCLQNLVLYPWLLDLYPSVGPKGRSGNFSTLPERSDHQCQRGQPRLGHSQVLYIPVPILASSRLVSSRLLIPSIPSHPIPSRPIITFHKCCLFRTLLIPHHPSSFLYYQLSLSSLLFFVTIDILYSPYSQLTNVV
ncbi:hypothetical protein B0J17DRAFT_713782 [Rhizoctonia solani]|nr:hypothetical protein B0J17DRAFT_713782 [Rhizoctonia solani]